MVDPTTNMGTSIRRPAPPAAVISLSFPSYETASLRKLSSVSLKQDDDKEFMLYSATNLSPLITSVCRLFGLLVSPYIILPVAPMILVSSTLPVILLFTFVVALCNISVYLLALPDSPVTNKEGYNAVGATTPPGLYHSKTSTFIQSILANSPLLTSLEAKTGGLPNLIPTFWMFSGDMRTLFPFLVYKPKHVEYVRRWVRVPLADGPLDGLKHEDNSHCDDDNTCGLYEAVAFDCACVSPSSSSSSSPATFSLVILAGLTGGSSEGYVLDLVNAANQQGIDCYVMLGRGLGGTVNLSDAAFHGARTSDVRECARVLRRALPPSQSLFVVGISMGGIIVINAVTRGDLTGLVDGAVSVSGCFDTAKNINFPHSRGIWQPALAHGLKESFVAPPGALKKMKRRMGSHAGMIVEKVVDVIDFDTTVVTALHGFRDVFHYYNDMCGGTENRLLAMVSKDRRKSKESHTANGTEEEQDEDEPPLIPYVNLDEVVKDALIANTNATENAKATVGLLVKQQQDGDTTISPTDEEWIEIAASSSSTHANTIGSSSTSTTATTTTTTTTVKVRDNTLAGLPVPLLTLNAADDPIIHVDTTPCQSGVVEVVDNLICLITLTGGHVGWPLTLHPWAHKFRFQNSLILEFSQAIVDLKNKSK